MAEFREKVTLNLIQKIFAGFAKKNLLILIIAAASAVIGFNFWFMFIAGNSNQPPKKSLISGSNLQLPEKGFGQVLSEATKSATSSSNISPVSGNVKIAALGDSMIDTLGDLKYFQLSLAQYYPKVEFTLLNYGVGATSPLNGLARLTQATTAPNSASGQPKNLPPLLVEKPDIVVLESYAYNHGQNTPSDTAAHYQTISEIVNTLSRSDIKVLFLVTIAPSQNYANGAPGILWDENQRILEAQTVIEYLKAGLKFAKDNNLILIDSFTPTLEKDGFGKQIYVNPQDNIHPSQEGIELISDLTAQKITKEKMIERVLGITY